MGADALVAAQIRVTVHPRKDKKTPKWMRTLQARSLSSLRRCTLVIDPAWAREGSFANDSCACCAMQGPVIETGSSWVVPSVAPADEGTGAAAAANPASLDEAASAASRAAASLIADFYEMEVRQKYH